MRGEQVEGNGGIELVQSGISGLDAILSAGIPCGNIVLLADAIGSGKTTLGVEFVYRGASLFGEPDIFMDFAMSSLVDNIILMNGIELGLGMTVAKMRANLNRRSTHECEILDGQGLRVLPRQIPGPTPHPFSSYQNLISRNPVRCPDRDVE
jgi:KaiC/GvpD/RAD55 family RecA-like ATPase